MNISAHTLDILQYKDVCLSISKHCVCEEAKTFCVEKNPSTNPIEIKQLKQLGTQFLDLLIRGQQPILQFFPPIMHILFSEQSHFKTLPIEDIYAIGLFTKSILVLKQWCVAHEDLDAQKELLAFISHIPDMYSLHTLIFSHIDNDGNIHLTPTLKKIQAEIHALEVEIKKAMNHYFSNEQFGMMLQSNVPTTRDGRQVLAIKANYKGRISGIIHEYSQTGQTFYIEPSDVVEKNNELFDAHAQYAQEVNRILRVVTQEIFEQKESIQKCLNDFCMLDTISAACKWGKYHNAHFLNEPDESGTYIALYHARHPLLKEPVPIDIILSPKTKVLIVTGPNTGGKTVTLKTVCLFALLNQSGFPVPCDEQSIFPLFDFIGCDVGDEQSIDLSLSTFSSHMKQISYCLENATENSLIALDELGNGTEPQEGAAIAMAILDELVQKKSFVLVTTHHGALKNYGYTNEFCENASVAFDAERLVPTYTLLMGVPGESHAFDIARKNGIAESIITKAEENMGEHKVDVGQLIQSLIEKNKHAQDIIKQLEEKEKVLNEKSRSVELKELKIKQKEYFLHKDGYARLNNLFEQKRRELENIIREIREAELTKEKIATTKNWLSQFERELQLEKENLQDEESIILKSEQPRNEVKGKILLEGQQIYVEQYNKSGTILRKERENVYLVELGNMKLTLPIEKISLVEHSSPIISVGVELEKNERPVLELRLLGMREAEAKKALVNQLDLAVISNLKEFSIVHGKGDGILQKMVHTFLRQQTQVSDFYFARPEEGGTGKTFVKLK